MSWGNLEYHQPSNTYSSLIVLVLVQWHTHTNLITQREENIREKQKCQGLQWGSKIIGGISHNQLLKDNIYPKGDML